MQDEAPELLPCPFCGGEAHQCITQDEGQRNDYDTVACDLCPATMERLIYWGDDDAARTKVLIAAWNTRADLPPTLAAAMAVPEIASIVKRAEAVVKHYRIVHEGYMQTTGALERDRLLAERPYIVGANDGWDAAVEQGETSEAVKSAMVRFWKRLAEIHLSRAEKAEATIAGLEARVEELAGALKPFSDAWGVAFDNRPEVVARLSLGELCALAQHHVPATAFRAARAALSQKDSPK